MQQTVNKSFSLFTIQQPASSNITLSRLERVMFLPSSLVITFDKLGRLSTKLARPKIASPNWVAANYHQRSEYAYNYKGIGSTYNYTAQKMLLTPTTGSDHDTVETRQFYDGLGRPNYQIKMMSSPALKDVIVATEYDNRGRAHKVFQPFESTGSTGFPISIPVNTKFTSNTYEESPLNRVKTTTPPSWYASTFDYGSNTSGTEVPNLDLGGNFIANSLTKSTVTNPDGNKTIVYKDKLGKEILTWKTDPSNITGAKTYSLYDDKNRVKTIVPPGATTAQTDAIFQYTYDGNDNVLTKKVPSRGIANFKYNTKNQLTLSQEAHFATNNWLYSIYDAYGRVSNYGMIVQASPNPDNAYTFSDEYMTFEYFTNATTDGVKFGKLKQNKTKILGTSSWLQADHEYDEFGRLRKITHGNHIYNVNNADSIVMAYNYADQVMTTKRSHRSASATRQTIDLRHIYDKMGRQTDEFITLNGGSEVKISNQKYTFKDQIAEKNIGGVTSPMNTYLQSIDYTYNEMGWLRQINQSSLSTPSLSFPNNTCSPSFPAPTNAGIAADPDVHDLFFQELRYDSVFTTTSGGFSGMPANLQKNGNIAQIAWRIKGRDMQAYNYTYDYLDRMLNSTYYNVAGTAATASNRYNENLTYDEKGNISTLNRRGYANTGVNTCTYDIIDNLNYTYNSEKSRLTSISDAANATYRPYGFSPGSGGVGYGYDANGNLKSDTYKGITNINYNHLNLPTIIQWGSSKSIEYTYDAGGNKLRKIVKTGVNTNAVKDYVAGIEYDTIPGSRIIESIYHSEGRYYNHTGTVTPTWRLEYSLRDHLGNTRISFSDLNSDGKIDVPSEILQENQYYAFGLEHEGNWKMTNIAEDMPYTYNGKEWNSEHNLKLYDYGARWYDPTVGRFTTTDRFTEKYLQMTPYQYGANNPISNIDVNGDSIKIAVGNGQFAYYENGKVVNGDGTQYNGRGVKIKKDGTVKLKGDLKKAVNALNQIVNGGASGQELISSLINSSNAITISIGDKNQAQGLNVTFNASSTEGGLNQDGGNARPAFVGLAHELVHAMEFDNKTIDYSIWFTTSDGKKVRKAEISASNYENRIRSENGISLRAYYSSNVYSDAALLNGSMGIYPTAYSALQPISSRKIMSVTSNKRQ